MLGLIFLISFSRADLLSAKLQNFKPSQIEALQESQIQLSNLKFSGCVEGWRKNSGQDECGPQEIAAFVNKRVSTLIYQQSFVLARNLTLADPVTYPGGQVALSSGFFSLLHPLDRIATLLHEAKHTDSGGLFHSECPYRMDLTLCDATENGPNGVQLAYDLNLYFYCESCTEEVRQQAKAWALARMTRISSFFPNGTPDIKKISEFAKPKNFEFQKLAEDFLEQWDRRPQ